MVSLISLWLPILLSGIAVFLVSSIIHMVFTYHQSDYAAVPDEAQARAAIGSLRLPPGQYALPKPANAKEMGDPAFQAKMTEGPVVMMTVWPNRPFAMGAQLGQWFVYSLVVGVFAGYVAGIMLPAGTDYLLVFRVTGTVAFAGYGLALLQGGIWSGYSWSSVFKSVFDALVYGLVTAGVFGWLWP